MKISLSTVLFVIGIASGSLDLVCFEEARYVIWNDGSGSTSILRETGVFQCEYIGNYGNLSISFFNSGAEDYIAAGCTNEDNCNDPGFLLVIDPQILGVVNSRQVSVEDFGYEAGAYAFNHLNLQKYYYGSDSLLLVGSISCCVTGESLYISELSLFKLAGCYGYRLHELH